MDFSKLLSTKNERKKQTSDNKKNRSVYDTAKVKKSRTSTSSVSHHGPRPTKDHKENKENKDKEEKEDSQENDPAFILTDAKKARIAECDKPNEQQKKSINAWINEQMGMGMYTLITQYDALIKPRVPKALAVPSGRAAFDAHADKNRYPDVVCLEPTRVKIKDGRPGSYIHANWVRGGPLINSFICTQGPKDNTVIDFWRMVVAEKARHIFMLCEQTEFGKVKCEKYWPVDEEEIVVFGDFRITNKGVNKVDGHVTVSTLVVEDKKGGKWRTHHHNWIDWPDKSAPKSLLAVFRLLKTARSSRFGVSVVHCSAGIGRTGTFVAIEYILQSLMDLKHTSLVKTVQNIRDMRMSSIQVEVQYLYLVAAIGKFAQNTHCLTPEVEGKFKKFLTEYEKHVAYKEEEMQKKAALSMQGVAPSAPRVDKDGMGLEGGKTMSTLPPGAKPEDFQKPDNAGTGFNLDLGPPAPKMEVDGGQNLSTVPSGTNIQDFPMPEGAGTDFKLDLTPAKSPAVSPPPEALSPLPSSPLAPQSPLGPGTGGGYNDLPTPKPPGPGGNNFASY